MNTYRIRKGDSRNWVVEKWQEGGEIITRGLHVGKEKQEKWDTINPVGHYPTARDAARRLLDVEIAQGWPTDGWTGADLTEVINAAEARVMAAVEAIDAEDAASTAPELDVTPEQIEEIEAATAPVATYLKLTGRTRFKRTHIETRKKLTPLESLMKRLDA